MHGIPKIGVILALSALGIGACDRAPEEAQLHAPASGCGQGGYLRGELFGAVQAEIDWSGQNIRCEGMRRPDDQGARLRFAGNIGKENRPVAFIVALPALQRGVAAEELASNVTLIEEGSGRFFSTTGLGSCWTDVGAQARLKDVANTYQVSGTLYCIAPLAEVNGDSEVTVRELGFSGLLDWGAK